MTKKRKSIENANVDSLALIAQHTKGNEELRILIQRTLYLKDFSEFVKGAWDIIEPGTPYSHNWHIDFLGEELTALFIDDLARLYPELDIQKIKKSRKNRLTINVPTRSMKTLLVSVFFPVWLALHRPTIKIASVSYSKDLSLQINRQRREIINSDWYQLHFGDLVKIKDGMDRQDMFELVSLGSMYATSIDGTFTGKGADLIILDDIQKPGDMYSEASRMDAVRFVKETLPTRLNNQKQGVIINIQQRLHYQDVTGFLQEALSSLYDFVVIPLEAETNLVYKGKITGRVWKMRKGDVLWPDRMGPVEVENLKLQLGAMAFAAQQQQNPTPDGGTIISRDWFKYYAENPYEYLANLKNESPSEYSSCQIIISWDMNMKVTKDSDYVGCVVGLYNMSKDTVHIIGHMKERLKFVALLSRVLTIHESWERFGLPIYHIVEEKANGSAVLEVMQQKIAGFIPYDPGNQDKVTRMKLVSPYIQSGNVFVPNLEKVTVPWANDFMNDLLKFPFLEHDDVPDAFSQLLTKVFVSKKKKRVYAIY